MRYVIRSKAGRYFEKDDLPGASDDTGYWTDNMDEAMVFTLTLSPLRLEPSVRTEFDEDDVLIPVRLGLVSVN